jgi:hypothetical protein
VARDRSGTWLVGSVEYGESVALRALPGLAGEVTTAG